MKAKPLIGYLDRLSVPAGGRVALHTSCDDPRYRAELVRLRHGDEHPDGPGFIEELVEGVAPQVLDGRSQSIRAGSCIVVEAGLDAGSNGFALQTWIYPTLVGGATHAIAGRWVGDFPFDGRGWSLGLDSSGAVTLWVGHGDGLPESVALRQRPALHQWTSVVASSAPTLVGTDAEIASRDLPEAPPVDETPLVIAGACIRDGKPVAPFNGRLDGFRLLERGITEDEARRLASQAADSPTPDLEWDFSRDIPTTHVTELRRGVHGTTVGMPTRGVRGHNWTGTKLSWVEAPSEYGAIHFHADDVEDAGWEVDAEIDVPSELESGVYAVRLRSAHAEDHVPFAVTPVPGPARAPIGVLLSTLTYLAYSAERPFLPHAIGAFSNEDAYTSAEGLCSLYNFHSDGSPVFYVSRLRPLPNLRPRYRYWLEGVPHGLPADLTLLYWLDREGLPYEVITDEDLDEHGLSLVERYSVLLTGSHPEYWTAPMMEAVLQYRAGGGNLMYLGGNGFFYVTARHSELPHMYEVRRPKGGVEVFDVSTAEMGELTLSFNGEPGGRWRNRRPRTREMVGVDLSAAGATTGRPYRRLPDSFRPEVAWIFEGVPADAPIGDAGLVFDAAAGYEIDSIDYAAGTPPGTLRLATATGFSEAAYPRVEGGTEVPHADMVYFEVDGGGAVFSVGSISWCGSLPINGCDNHVARVTGNVLRRFASG